MSYGATQTDAQEMDVDGDDEDMILLPPSRPQSKQRVLTAGQASQPHVRPPGKATEGLEQPSAFPFLPQVTSPASSLASGSVSVPAAFSTALPK
jgi:hypothetical protein